MIEEKNRKAQEEIVGFVLVVVIVAIIFLVFLGIAVRQSEPVTQKESGDVSRFLESMMEYTTDCAIVSEYSYLSLGELVKECNSGTTCLYGGKSCDALKRTIQGAVEANWRIGPDRPIKGYLFNSTYSSESRAKEVLAMTKGNCTYERIGGEYEIPAYPGNIRVALEMCY